MRLTRTHGARALLLATACIAATACEDEIAGPGDDLVEGELTVDASDQVSFAYATFADGGSTLSVADPSTSTDWQIAFRRFSVKLNGGVAGPGDVAGVNLENNASATDADVVAFTQADADAAWEAVTEADIDGVTFAEDGIIADMSGPWFRFDPISGTLVANSGAAWKVRQSDGDFALLRVSDMTLNGNALVDVTFEYRHQEAGGTPGAAQTVTVDVTGGPGFVDLEGGAAVTPAGCNWDLSIAPSFQIEFNASCDAGTFPLDATESFPDVTDAGDAPEYGGFLSVVSGAFPGSVSDASGVFWYNIEGNNRLWPTFNVFLVRVGSSVFKVQVTDYYSATGEAGVLTVRFEQLR